MLSAHERRIQAIVIFLTLSLHFFLLCILFILTRRKDLEPLRITANPQFIEYLLHNLTQQPPNAAQQHTPTPASPLPGMTPALAQAIQTAQAQLPPEPDEPGFDRYMLKNAVSYGSFTQGSIVAASQEQGNPHDKENQTEPTQEPLTAPEIPSVNTEKQSSESSDTQTESELPEHAEETSEQQELGIDPMSGISPIITAAEEVINDAGSSWVTPSQTAQTMQTCPRASTHTSSHAGTGSPQKAGSKTGASTRSLTLADITRSYVKHATQEQEATSRYTSGSPAGRIAHGAYAPPTSGIALSEQLYASKLYNLLEQSAQAYSQQIYSCRDLDMQTVIEVTIEKSGKIVDVTLNPAIPEKDMERALCLIVRKVGLFPPIPRQFHKQRIILSIPIRIHSKQGFASYCLLYGLSSV